MVRFRNRSEIQAQFQTLAGRVRRAYSRGIYDAYQLFALRFVETMRRRTRRGGGRLDQSIQRTPAGSPPRTRSGTLSRSFQFKTYGGGSNPNLDNLRVEMFSTAGVVAFAQEFGTRRYDPESPIATIRPKTSKYLTIPLPGALTPTGRLKRGAQRARDFPDTFFVTSKRGNLLIAQAKRGRRVSSRGQIVPLFLLKKSVDLRPRLGMRSAFRTGIKRHLLRDMVEQITKQLARIGR